MTDDNLDLETAFALLADDVRVRIVNELGAATAEPETGIPHLSYAELKERVGIRDSGRFNYHLTKLLGTYVAKADEGYRLRWPGMVLYRTLVAGLLTSDGSPDVGRFPVGATCHRCGDPIEAHLYETLFRVRCWGCDANYADVYLPSNGLTGRSEADLLDAVHRRIRTVFGSMTAGQCPWCAASVSVAIHGGSDELPSLHDTRDLDAYAVYHCTDCTGFQYAPVSQTLVHQPVAIAFYHDHGRDLTSIPTWELAWAVTDQTTTVRGTDPWRFTVRVPLDDETLVADLDADLSVTETRRESGSRDG